MELTSSELIRVVQSAIPSAVFNSVEPDVRFTFLGTRYRVGTNGEGLMVERVRDIFLEACQESRQMEVLLRLGLVKAIAEGLI